MNGKNKIDEIPEEFKSYEIAAEFWDNHDTTDYLDEFETIKADVKLTKRRFEIEIDADLMSGLSKEAHNKGVQISRLVSDLIRDKIHSV
ncbi:MAG: CopG family antitoxin [Aridibacter sp.]